MLILAKLKKLASNLLMNITKMRKTLKSQKFIIILIEIWTEEQKFS